MEKDDDVTPVRDIHVDEIIGPSRLCRDCKHLTRFGKECTRPGLPVNLVDGKRRFPAIVARGYDNLCGVRGTFWERG